MKKKMLLTARRLTELKQPGAQYVIRCPGRNRSVEGHRICDTGFFSHYLRALFGIRLAVRYRVPYSVDYGHVPHVYSDTETFPQEPNFWNYYFQPSGVVSSSPVKEIISRAYETHPVRIWKHGFIMEMNQLAQQHLFFRPEVEKEVMSRQGEFAQEQVLGVHIRRTDHWEEIEPISLNAFKQAIRRNLRYCSKVFIATDDQLTLDEIREEFGERVLFNEVHRSHNYEAVHAFPSSEGFQLGLEALTDAYSLSFCSKLILVHSNLSYAARILNPTAPYLLLETRKHALSRWKTLGAYYLDLVTTRLPSNDSN
ncbi:MAG: hypothetical protein AAF944_22035 [Bacteroidota bacterium]